MNDCNWEHGNESTLLIVLMSREMFQLNIRSEIVPTMTQRKRKGRRVFFRSVEYFAASGENLRKHGNEYFAGLHFVNVASETDLPSFVSSTQ